MANAPVLKTGVRKDLGVRIPRPPLVLPRAWPFVLTITTPAGPRRARHIQAKAVTTCHSKTRSNPTSAVCSGGCSSRLDGVPAAAARLSGCSAWPRSPLPSVGKPRIESQLVAEAGGTRFSLAVSR